MKNTILFLAFISTLFACSVSKNTSNFEVEQHRPQFHFTPQKGWMNDPNGLIYYAGEYHLFYQHFPDTTVWGPMHWGHAVSKDLVSWEHLPIALYPDTIGCIFSGSAVLDEKNTSGFQQGNEKPLVAIFTYHNLDWERAGRLDRESQGIAYSLDKGRTWVKYDKNPVLKNKGDVDFRDPKVFWHEESQYWIMSLAVGNHLELFRSKNLKNWDKISDFGLNEGSHGGVWECPDLFSIRTSKGIKKWVLLQNIGRGAATGGSGTQYFVGDFDGKIFKNDNSAETVLWFDYGADNYAGVTWMNAPNNRRLFIGWMSNWDDYAQTVPTKKWRSALTVPRELSLEETPEGFRLMQKPVIELEKLRAKTTVLPTQDFSNFLPINEKSTTKEVEFSFDLSKTTANEIGFFISNTKNESLWVGYNLATKTFYTDKTKAGKSDFSEKFAKRHDAPYKASNTLIIKALIDASSIEIFIDNGKLAMTEIFFPSEDFTEINLFAKGGKANLTAGKVFLLKKIGTKIGS